MLSTFVFSLSVLNLLILGLDSSSSTAPEPPTPVDAQKAGISLTHPTWSLGLGLYKALRSRGSHINTLISPALVASSLSVLGHADSTGSTAVQVQELLKTVIGEKSAEEAVTSALKSIHEGNGTSYALRSTSALFSKQGTTLEKSFLEKMRVPFGFDHVVLGADSEQAIVEELRSWAKSGMGGIEAALLSEGPETHDGAFILANALHFKGLWDRGFEQDNEDLRTFLGAKYTKVRMMHQAGVYRHYEDMQNMVQVLELVLWGGKATMLLLLPFQVESLARLERVLSVQQLEQWTGKMSSVTMALSLPRVNVSSAVSLKEHLTTLGLVDAWDQKLADFSVASPEGKRKLHLAGVLQWASLQLTAESGREDGMNEDVNVEKPKLFYADHPFVVLVTDNGSGALLLLGALDLAEGPALHDEL